jgi:nitroreductase
MPEIGLFEAIYSARSLHRLKPDPVPEALITKILDAAIRAPSAGNAQNWAFVVVRDPEQRRKLGAIYRKASDIAAAMYAARGRPPHLTEQQFARIWEPAGIYGSTSARLRCSLSRASTSRWCRRASRCRPP